MQNITKFITSLRRLNSARILNRGFSIAELIVVIAIFAIITTVALLDQNRLNSSVLISNLGYETALAIREAQVYGVGVRNEGVGSPAFNGQYGTYFDINKPERIVVYADRDNDTLYSAGSEEQFIYNFTQQRGNKIKALCVKDQTNPALSGGLCAPAATLKTLRIVFTRPSLEAKFYAEDMSNNPPVALVGPAYIVLNNIDNNNCRVVIVEPTGQIRVEKGTNQGGTYCSNS